MKELPLLTDDSNLHEQPRDWDNLAEQLAEQKNWDQAAAALQHAADIDPFHVWRWLKIARWRLQCGQYALAIATISRAIHLPPIPAKSTFDEPAAWTREDEKMLWAELAYMHAQNSRWEECEQACLEALERDPESLQIMELMTTACMQTLHLDAAEQLLQNLLQRAPMDPWFRLRYATLLQMQGKSGNAQRELQRLQALKLPEQLKDEVDQQIKHLDDIQIHQVGALLQNDPALANTLARNPQQQLEEMGFHVTDSAVEIIQNLLWEHFDQSPWLSLERPNNNIRLH